MGVSANYGFAVKADGGTGIIPGRVITKPGACEVRYVTGVQHQVLARNTVIVTE